MRSHQRHVGKGLFAGLVGGLIGTIVMNEFQNAWSKASQALSNGSAQKSQESQQTAPEKEDATMKAAGKIARLTGRELTHEQRKKFGPVVHYSFGTLQGGIYGSVTELKRVRGGFLPALAFGSALFVAADEVAVPSLGLAPGPTKTPVTGHLFALASHLVYGVSAEMVRRGVRAALG